MGLISRIGKKIKVRAFQAELRELVSKPFNAENMKEFYGKQRYEKILTPGFVTAVQEGSEDYLKSVYDQIKKETLNESYRR